MSSSAMPPGEQQPGDQLPGDRPQGQQLPRPPAVRIDARRVVAAGTALWLLGFLVLLGFWGWLGTHGHRAWLWTCLAGAVLGVVGYALMAKHRREGRSG